MRRLLLAVLTAPLLAVSSASAQESAIDNVRETSGATFRISAFSGKPVPRFESLKYTAVHGRTGPSLDYPIAWRYERQGLPVLIVKESRDWRMVRDPSGDEVWMHERTLGGRPSVMVFGDDLAELKAQPKADGRVLARIEQGAIANLIRCEDAFCEVFLDRRKGWIPRNRLWGAPGTSPKALDLQHIAENTADSVVSR